MPVVVPSDRKIRSLVLVQLGVHKSCQERFRGLLEMQPSGKSWWSLFKEPQNDKIHCAGSEASQKQITEALQAMSYWLARLSDCLQPLHQRILIACSQDSHTGLRAWAEMSDFPAANILNCSEGSGEKATLANLFPSLYLAATPLLSSQSGKTSSISHLQSCYRRVGAAGCLRQCTSTIWASAPCQSRLHPGGQL